MSALPSISITMEAHTERFDAFRADLDRQLSDPGSSGPVRDCLMEQWPATYFAAMSERFDRYAHGGGDWRALSPRTIMGRRGSHRAGGKIKLRIGNLDPEKQKEIRGVMHDFTRDMMDDLTRERGALPKKPKGGDDPDAKERAGRCTLAKNYGRLRAYNEFRERGETIPTAKQTAEGMAGDVAILMDTGTLFKGLGPNSNAQIRQGIRYGVEVGLGPGATHDQDSGLTIGRLAWIQQTGAYRGGQPRPIIVEPNADCWAKLNAQLDAALTALQRQHGVAGA